MRLVIFFAFLIVVMQSSGCAFVNVDVSPRTQPFQEKVLEGEGEKKILIIDISGFISEKERSGNQLVREKPSTVAEVKEALQKAEQDEDLAGVVLRINSPGGTVTASDIIHHEILRFKQRTKIPVYACITGVGASGGYYVAAATDQIYAHPTAITGSIGVILMKFNVEGLLTKIGVGETTFKSGDKKDILSPFRAATAEDEKLIQNIVMSLHQRFLSIVEARPGNNLTRPQIEAVGDGRIFTAEQAFEAKLVDRIGYLEEAINALKQASNLEAARIITYYRPGSYKGSIYSAMPEAAPAININLGGDLEAMSSPQFLYLWRP